MISKELWDNANRHIADDCRDSWRKANINPKTGYPYKKHRPYCPSLRASHLIAALRLGDSLDVARIIRDWDELGLYTTETMG